MAQTICVGVNAAERDRLLAIADDRCRLRKHVVRARIVLASGGRHSPQRVAQSVGVSRPTVWRWQQRCRVWRGRAAARQDLQARQGAAGGGTHAAGGGADLQLAAAPSDPLDRPGGGQDDRHLAGLGAAHQEGAQIATAPTAHLQALERARVCRKADRHRRAECRSAGPCGGVADRRDEPDPGARPHSARMPSSRVAAR